MELADHSTIVSRIGNELTNDGRPVREAFVSIAGVMNTAWVESAHKTCPTGSTDGALTVCMSKGGSFGYQLVNDRGANEAISQGANGVKSLLVGTVPKDIWLFIHFKIGAGRCWILFAFFSK